MSAADNPYRTPKALSDIAPEAALAGELTVLRRALRVVALGAIGFVVFFAIGTAIVWMRRDAYESAAWGMGIVGAALFAASEMLYLAPNVGPGFFRRFVVTVLVFLVTGVAAGFIAAVLGWDLRVLRGDPHRVPPHQLHHAITFFSLFVLTQLVLRRIMAKWYREETPDDC
jgi:hypothetical protein